MAKLAENGIRTHCLQLGGADLTSPAGGMVMRVLSAVAQFERELLIERTQSGLARARSEGKTLGRKQSLSSARQAEVMERRRAGDSLGTLSKAFGVSRASIQRIEKRASAQS